MKVMGGGGRHGGFTLIELSVVLVVIGIIISIAATLLPGLIQSGKIRKAEAIMERAETSLVGYLLSNHRLPCPDTDDDGRENPAGGVGGDCSAYVGDLPYLDLGLASPDDAWNNPLRYGVYGGADGGADLTAAFDDRDDLCRDGRGLEVAAASSFDSDRIHTAADSDCGGAASDESNQGLLVVSGGAKAQDPADGFFDCFNGDGTALRFNRPNKIIIDDPQNDAAYDDLVRGVALTSLVAEVCGGGAGGGGVVVPGGNENCSNGVDDDSDGAVDCQDPDCATHPQCVGAQDVTIIRNTIPDVTLGGTLFHGFQATGGESEPEYFWELTGQDAVLGDALALNRWTGQLAGAVAACPGSYAIEAQAEDRTDGTNSDAAGFDVTIVQGTLAVSPVPRNAGPADPDFRVDGSVFQQDFSVSGDFIGPFADTSAWTINWIGDDPGGLQIDPLSDTRARLRKSGTSAAGDFAFTLTVTDDACPTNTFTTAPYALEVTPGGVGAPFTQGLAGHWALDECSWGGPGAVLDSGDGGADATARGDAVPIGSGRLCGAGFFDGAGDYVEVGAISGVFDGGDDAFTATLWVRPQALSGAVTNHGTANVVLARASDPDNDNFELGINPDGTVHVYIDASGSDAEADFGVPGAVPVGEWRFIAVTYDGATVVVHVDDVSDADTTTWAGGGGLDDAAASPVTIGASLHIDNFFHGWLDEVRLWNRKLSDEELAEVRAMDRTSCAGACYTGPTAEYRMEQDFPWDGSAGEVKDAAGDNNGAAAARGSGELPTQTAVSAGKVCRAAAFVRLDASNGGYLDLGDPADGDLDPGNSPMTVSGWLNWDGSSGDNMIFNKENLYEARVLNGQLQYAWRPHWVWDGGNSFAVAADTWSHFTIVYDGRRQTLYKDGAQVFSRSQSGAIGANSNPLRIGARGTITPFNFYGGLLDELRLYRRALAVNEIEGLVTADHACAADVVVIDGIDRSTVTLGETLVPGSGILPGASGGTLPYVWQLAATDIPGLVLDDNLTGEVVGTVDSCAGNRDITLAVTDDALNQDLQTFSLTVVNDTLVPSPAPGPGITCTNRNFTESFSVGGGRLGELGAWGLIWQGADPGGFGVVKTGPASAEFRKTGASAAGNYRFKLTAEDASCPTNRLDTGFYDLTINPPCTAAP